MLTTTASYRLIMQDLPRSLSNTAAKPQVARETEYYLAHIGNIKSIDDFLADDRIFAYAMKAFGLEDMTYAKAFMRKVLTEGIDAADSFANTLTDKRYREFAQVFDFATYGETTTIFDRTRQGTVDRYVRQTLEEEAGQQNEGVQLALYFERKAADIDSPYDILADKALTKVVQTALGLPETTSLLDIDKQAALIESHLDLADLQDPEKLEKFLNRFTSLYELSRSDASTNPAVLLLSPPRELGLSADLLASLQNLKLGGS